MPLMYLIVEVKTCVFVLHSLNALSEESDPAMLYLNQYHIAYLLLCLFKV